MIEHSEVQALWQELSTDLRSVAVVWQFTVIRRAVLVGGLFRRWFTPRASAVMTHWQQGADGMRRVVFPIAALAVVEAGKHWLAQMQSVRILNLAASLLIALVTIRLLLYALRTAFPSATWMRASERTLTLVIWAGFALHVTGQLAFLLDGLNSVGFKIGNHELTLLMVLNGVLSVSITVLIALWLGKSLERRILSSQVLDASLRVVLSKLTKTLLVVVAVMIALPLVGIDLTLFSVFGGALGVGLGLGLQKIASNYVSGFIILLDRSIRLGDLVTVDGRVGEVSRLTARYIVLRGLDGTEAIIPNDTLVTSTVLNHSYSDRRVRVVATVQISYDSDLDAAKRILLEALQGETRVLSDPAPGVAVNGFATDGIILELGFWIADPELGSGGLKSAVYEHVYRTFPQHNIRIPYPQREVRWIGPPGGAAATEGAAEG